MVSDMDEARPVLRWFYGRMYKKLYRHRSKPFWRTEEGFTSETALERMFDEIIELVAAYENGHPQEVVDEAADVANFAMMVADLVRMENKVGR